MDVTPPSPTTLTNQISQPIRVDVISTPDAGWLDFASGIIVPVGVFLLGWAVAHLAQKAADRKDLRKEKAADEKERRQEKAEAERQAMLDTQRTKERRSKRIGKTLSKVSFHAQMIQGLCHMSAERKKKAFSARQGMSSAADSLEAEARAFDYQRAVMACNLNVDRIRIEMAVGNKESGKPLDFAIQELIQAVNTYADASNQQMLDAAQPALSASFAKVFKELSALGNSEV
jgi:hypothetical protein